MGRLSAYAKNQILKLRFQKHNKITQIVKILTKEDIKISRQSVSTFLKKYLETDSILDKPRSGRKKKLTNDEIQQIGELTRSDPNITARSIKDKLRLTVSTYTILRASKLFEWNKVNPNSNEAKKAAALERELRGERRRKAYPKKTKKLSHDSSNETLSYLNQSTSSVELAPAALQIISLNQQQQTEQQHQTANDLLSLNSENLDDLYDLKLITEREIISLKNTACSPMSFATKVLFRIFSVDELHGHNVSGKTFHKHISHKEPLEEKRLMYIKWLVEKYFYYPFLATNSTTSGNFTNDNNAYYYKNKDVLWKACCNAINKMIRRSEVNQIKAQEKGDSQQLTIQSTYHSVVLNDNQENLIEQQQQQQQVLVHQASAGSTNLSKFSQLTQYLNEERNPGNADSSFIDEIELISHKRQLYQAKIEVGDDSDSEIELLNENKLMMNITNQKNLALNSCGSNSAVVVSGVGSKRFDEESEDEMENENVKRRKIAPVEGPIKRSARLANKKPVEVVKKTENIKAVGKELDVVKKRKSNYYYESDDEDSDEEEEDDDISDDGDDEDDDSEDMDSDDDDDEVMGNN
jgi:transposase